MRSVFDCFFRKLGEHKNNLKKANGITAFKSNDEDVTATGFPLVPDGYHLQHVGKTVQGNGYWIDVQLATEGEDTRDFVAAYIFDKKGNLIHSEVVDRGLRNDSPAKDLEETIGKLKKKIDAKDVTEILVKPFSVSFHGNIFGLVIRETEDGEAGSEDTVIDAMPGHTLMFYGPWSLCNYDS